jgi:hypothetical protein
MVSSHVIIKIENWGMIDLSGIEEGQGKGEGGHEGGCWWYDIRDSVEVSALWYKKLGRQQEIFMRGQSCMPIWDDIEAQMRDIKRGYWGWEENGEESVETM